ncbi:MAG: transcriptional regulator [Candidatus Binatia bacterium]
MRAYDRTPRQRILDLLVDRRMTARQLAVVIKISERQVEDHLTHLVKSLERDRSRRFVIEPSECLDCEFVFKERSRITRPSHCPRCRSENTSAPRYGVEVVTTKTEASDEHP